MATVKPFKAIRPAKGKEKNIAALPYDVYNRMEAKEAVKNAPLSFLRIDRAETQLPDDVDMYDDCVYQKAKELLSEQIEKGDYVTDSEACFYLYELIMNGRSQTGIVACASIDDYLQNVIKKHENTRADKEVDRIKHVDTLNAQTGPIFLAYRDEPVLNQIINRNKEKQPIYDFTSEDGITHKVYVIDDVTDINRICEAFRAMKQIYIADGHHRCASAVKVGLKRRDENPGYKGTEEFNYFLSVLFPENELMIMDYNRVIRDLNGLSEKEFMDKLLLLTDILEKSDTPIRPRKKGQVSMFLNEVWYLLAFKAISLCNDPVKGLDVSVLQDCILQPLLGITDPKTDKRIDFVGGIRGLEELERRVHTDMKVAFAMYPTSIQELFAVADAGLLMPPKSTWFEPKLRSGLFIHSL